MCGSNRRRAVNEPIARANHHFHFLYHSGDRSRYRSVPLSLMVINSLKKSTEIVANPLALPGAQQWGNFTRAWTDAQLGRSLLNSTVTTGAAVVLICSTCSM